KFDNSQPEESDSSRRNAMPVDAWQLVGNLTVAACGAWIGGKFGVRHALDKLRNERAFERRLTWYEDTVAALVTARDLCVAYAAATRQRDAALLAKLAPQMGATLHTFAEKANKVVLYAPTRTLHRFDTLVRELLGLAPGFIQTLERDASVECGWDL